MATGKVKKDFIEESISTYNSTAITLPNSFRGLVVCFASGTARMYLGIVFVSGDGVVILQPIYTGTDITTTTSTNTLTIANAGGSIVRVRILDLTGN